MAHRVRSSLVADGSAKERADHSSRELLDDKLAALAPHCTGNNG
jgi:hypothetical protein